MPKNVPFPPLFTLERWKDLFAAVVKLLGIIALIGAAVGAIYAGYQNRHLVGIVSSTIEIRPLASTKAYLLFLAENSGNKPASIGRITGQFHFAGSGKTSTSAPLRLDVLEYDEGQIIVNPGAAQKIRVHFAITERLKTLLKHIADIETVERTHCLFEFEISNYDSLLEQKKVEFDCRRYAAEYLRMRNQATITIPF
ncbi:MAG: hypothetical protein ACKVP5_08965 [Aestuariivirga sp.]